MSVDDHRARRQFERTFPGIAYQEHLRWNNPERYEEHMRDLANRPIESEGREVAHITYWSDGYVESVYRREEGGKLVYALRNLLEQKLETKTD